MMDNRSVLLLSPTLEGMNDILSVQRRERGSKTQRSVTYHLDEKSSVGFYLCIFFDLMDLAYVSSYLIYNMKHPNKSFLLSYKIVVTKNLIQ